jgi:outer membrane lipoprotein SlyB
VYHAQRVSHVYDATVLAVRPITIDGSQSGVGAGAGAIVGGIAGSAIGGGNGAAIATVLGAVVGGVAGNAIERDSTKQNGVEIIVQMRDGQRRAVVQGVTSDAWAPGDPVIVIVTGATPASRERRRPRRCRPTRAGHLPGASKLSGSGGLPERAGAAGLSALGPGAAAQLKRLAERLDERSADLRPRRPAGLDVALVDLELDADVALGGYLRRMIWVTPSLLPM